MEQDLAVAREREAGAKRRASRRSRWLSRRCAYRTTARVYRHRRFNVVVFRNGASWGARFVDKRTVSKSFSPRPYASEAAAKFAAFDAITRYKAR
jgi:hypothetical protein